MDRAERYRREIIESESALQSHSLNQRISKKAFEGEGKFGVGVRDLVVGASEVEDRHTLTQRLFIVPRSKNYPLDLRSLSEIIMIQRDPKNGRIVGYK